MNSELIYLLNKLEITQKEFWNIAKETGNFLNLLVKMSDSKHVLEIGTSNGYSGLWFLDALSTTNGHLTTIEFHDSRRLVAIDNFNKAGFEGKYDSLKGEACDILNSFSKETFFDFVFIDANKREYIEYYKIIKPHLLPHAIITADNVNSHRQKVQPFLDAITSDSDFQTEILDLPGGLSVSYKLN